jgi:CrcB protein
MVINLSAALLIGLAYGCHLETSANIFWATGILGGYSTFSAPVVELANAMSTPSDRPFVLVKTAIAFIGGIPVLLLGAWLGSLLG